MQEYIQTDHSIYDLGKLESFKKGDLPAPVQPKKMLLSGLSVLILATGLGSGEFIIFPTLTLKYGFAILWAAWVGLLTQYLINMEISRYTLVSGETILTGFTRLWKPWAWIFLACNILPWMWPGWATGGAQCASYIIPANITGLAIGGLVFIGLALSLGPVIHKTTMIIQTLLVISILVFMITIAIFLFNLDTIIQMVKGSLRIGYIPQNIELSLFLTALAFAGAGGTLNIAQSEYIREKGYGMGRYIGRLCSPITGKKEPVASTGYYFECNEDNMNRWKIWWKSVSLEHFVTFFILGTLSIFLLSFIAYSTVYGTDVGSGLTFIYNMGEVLGKRFGSFVKIIFYMMGAAILFTTELGILDATSRISSDIIQTNTKIRFSKSVLYLFFLWFEIILGIIILTCGVREPVMLLKIAGSLNGFVMALYSILLLYSNSGRILGRSIAMRGFAFAGMCWAVGLYGYFSLALAKGILRSLFG
jgi:hypothetical protein